MRRLWGPCPVTGDAKGNPVPAAWVGEDVMEVAQAKLEGHEGLSGQKQEEGRQGGRLAF